MKLQDVMTGNPESVSADASITDVARKMKSRNVGAIPVVEGTKPIGIITDRDIVIRGIAEGRQLSELHARDCMSTDLVFCSPEDDVKNAAKEMQKKQIRRVLVVDRNDHRLLGIVSLGDLAVEMDKKLAGNTIEKVSEPAAPRNRKVA